MGQETEADTILANALLEDAAAHDAGAFDRIAARYDDVLAQLLPIQDVDERRFSIAFAFWDGWCGASTSEWRAGPQIDKSDWPRLARHIAERLAHGEAATDSAIVEHFAPENRPTMRRALRGWLRRLGK